MWCQNDATISFSNESIWRNETCNFFSTCKNNRKREKKGNKENEKKNIVNFTILNFGIMCEWTSLFFLFVP